MVRFGTRGGSQLVHSSDSKVRYITSREDMKRGIAREGGRPGLV